MTSNNSDGSSTCGPNRNHQTIDLVNDKATEAQPIDLTGTDNEDDDEDADLKLAIALSLQGQQSFELPSRNSHNGARPTPPPPSVSTTSETSTQPKINDTSTQSSSGNHSGLLGLDRKQMEAARLTRLKRKREATAEDCAVSPPPLRRTIPPSTQHTSSTDAAVAILNPGNVHKAESTFPTVVPTSSTASTIYPQGEILLTSVNKAQARSISFPELLKSTVPDAPLKSALLCSFIFDFDWLFPHFDTRKVSFVLAAHASNDQAKHLLQQDFAGIQNVRLVFPYVGGIVNCMHSKLMLLFYENAGKDPKKARCRLVVPSANLVPWDWGVEEMVQNILFVIDLPLKDESVQEIHTQDTEFKKGVMEMLQAKQVPKDVLNKLEAFDFSATEAYRFVHSIGGSHSLTPACEPKDIEGVSVVGNNTERVYSQALISDSPFRTGLLNLCEAVRSLDLCTTPGKGSCPLLIDFITSSIGNIKKPFLQSLIMAACGQKLESPATPIKRVKSSQIGPIEETKDSYTSETTSVINNMKVYFPSDETVRNSKGGPASAGTITFQSKWWDGPEHDFFRKMLCDCVGIHRDGVLLHSKALFARFAKPKKIESAPRVQCQRAKLDSNQSAHPLRIRSPLVTTAYSGWAYIGSANLSQSAWGNLTVDSRTKQLKLNCRNWESGVLIPVSSKLEHEGKNLHDRPLEEIFGDIIPVPIQYPGDNIQESGKRPWFFSG